MNVIFTCGGTGGHINPAIAVANQLKERCPETNILFVGGQGDLEEKLIPSAGYPLKTIATSGMARGASFSAIKHNLGTLGKIFKSVQKCKKIIKEFNADVIIGTGGHASFPTLMAGTLLKVPTCVHEANAMPGLTTRMIADRVDRVLTCFPESAKYYRHPEKIEIVGMPVRREFIYTEKEAARKELGLDERPVIVSAFGSQGARAMNEMVADMFVLEQQANYSYQHIHAAGSYGWRWMPEYVRDKGVDLNENKGICMKEYIYNMPTVMAAADIVISRAGASTCNEIAATGTPCILIPSPNVTDNHQEKNALALADQGGAIMIRESECTAQRVFEEISGILNDQERYRQMRHALQNMVVLDSAERLCNIVLELGKAGK